MMIITYYSCYAWCPPWRPPPLNISTPSFKGPHLIRNIISPPSPPFFRNGSPYSLIHRVANCLNETLRQI